MGGHDHCCVYGCDHRRDKLSNTCSFFNFPKNQVLKARLVHASGRQDLSLKSLTNNVKVCGCHFISGKPDRRNKESVDNVPNQNIPSTLRKKGARQSKTSKKSTDLTTALTEAELSSTSVTNVAKRCRRKLSLSEIPSPSNEIQIPIEIQESEPSYQIELPNIMEEAHIVDSDHTYSNRCYSSKENTTVSTQTTESTIRSEGKSDNNQSDLRIKHYQQYIIKLRKQLAEKEAKSPSFNHHMMKSDKDAMFWTGLPSKAVFMALYKFLEPRASNLTYRTKTERHRNRSRETKISLIDEFFAVLARLKVGLLIPDVSSRLGISVGHFSKMFEKWIKFLRHELECITRFPTLSEIQKHLPESFNKYPNTRVIIDCTELYCQKPSSLKSQRQLWSNYKHHNTYKALVGISPDGSVVFVSNLYGGACSDKFITKDCGLLEHLTAGDHVMADRGFQISDLLPLGVQLNIPPFLNGQGTQLTAEQVEETRRIASVRIHVERVIQLIKIFHILDGVMPLTLHHVAEVCSYLTNFQTPVIASV